MAQVVKRTLNAEIPYVPWLTGYLAIVVGALVTFLVQSSSVFTSTLVSWLRFQCKLNCLSPSELIKGSAQLPLPGCVYFVLAAV